MNKYLKKFGIMFVTLLGIIGVGVIQHGTMASAATVGQGLTAPESGWARYDDTDSRIKYVGKWFPDNGPSEYNSTATVSGIAGEDAIIKFKGTKFRIIGTRCAQRSTSVSVYVDDTYYNDFNAYGNGQYQALYMDISSLRDDIHTIKIVNNAKGSLPYFSLDAIDIDDTVYLINPDESISLNQSSMDINVNDSQQLTATTTPAGAQVTWSSSDSSIATVDSTGKVTGVKEGNCTITATTADGLTATCTVTVNPKDTTQPTDPTEPTGDANLYIELVDGQIKQYSVSSDEINKFTEWYENRDNDHSLPATYKFTKGSYTDYVVQNQIDWFEVR